jgi:signal transduction histidine kinase
MPPPHKHCLLVVDDEAHVVQSLKDLLRFDYRVLTATRASDGLKLMEKEKVHVVMSDQRMPEMSGVEFLSQLKETHPESVRLLFTAYADLQAVTDAINQGNVYRYISKPWEPDDLMVTLRQAVDYYDLQEERRSLLKEIQAKNLQLESANQELRLANDLKRAFIKVAGHELRTPLTIILGLSELGATHQQIVPPLKEWVEQIFRSSRRLNERVDQVVRMLQAEQFDRTLRARDVELAELLRGAARDVASFVQQRRQELIVEAPPDLGTIHIEPEKINDSIVQLLANAIKFTPDRGTIRLSARRTPDGGAEIAVADTGVGIDPASQSRIFDPFFTRFDVSRHSSGDFEFERRGLGLGLSMVKMFVEMHGGRVDVQSEPGKGSTFTVVLPPTKA